MIRASILSHDGQGIILGVSRENVKRLMEGKPIYVSGESVKAPWLTGITIFFGETEADMEKALREADMIGPETIVNREG